MINDFFESNRWFKDLDLFSSWCTFGDMAPKLNFAMKSPTKVMKAPKAKCKAKAKAKADPKPKPDPKAKAKVKNEPPKTRRLQRSQMLKFRVMTNRFSILFFPGLMTQGLNPSRPFTMEWLEMIPRRKSLLFSGS